MNEEKQEIKLPNTAGRYISWQGDWSVLVTKRDAQAIRNQCDAILAEKPRPERRDGDVVQVSDTPTIRIRTGGKWRRVDTDSYVMDDLAMGCPNDHFRFNIRDVLVQGPIVVGLTEEEAEHIVSPHHHDELCVTCSSVFNRLSAALARYREDPRKEG